MPQGKVKYYNQEKGYGFIATESRDIFFHVANVVGMEPKKGDITYYESGETQRGVEAFNVSVVNFNA